MSKREDNRGFMDDDMKKLRVGGELHPFIELAKKYDKDLQVCFRGNGSPKYMTIYFNNRQVYKVKLNGRVEISYRTARYWKDCAHNYNKLVKYGFKVPSDFADFLKNNSYDIAKTIDGKDNFENIYVDVLRPMLENYSKNDCYHDYFKNKPGRSHPEIEKKEQQRLFLEGKHIDTGYFFYDLEFHQKGAPKADEPDMLGIYFEKGKPKNLAFVEVKSTSTKENIGNPNNIKGSGVWAHLSKVSKFIDDKDFIDRRKREAWTIMKNYADLGLRGLNSSMNFDEKEFEEIEPQALFLFTKEAIEAFRQRQLEDKSEFCWKKRDDVHFNDCIAYSLDKDEISKILQKFPTC